ncbi:MAG: PepSY-associated TM helix domain-containing protein [Phycisphaerae bacterium]|jgi:uncharacterized iron-regulated membrane protein|nr:PepSY-associated TM helix domain-containing protein [Phycisphaerae bacterium]
MKLSKINRVFHRWGSILALAPIMIIIVSGLILQLKKEAAWIQPPTQRGTGSEPSISLDRILEVAKTVPQAEIKSWDDIDRLDVRPGKGVVKVRCKNGWEVQIDTQTGQVLQTAVRRSDLIESIHDGSYFHESFRLWVFLPSGLILAILAVTGLYLFSLPHLARRKRRRKELDARSQ